MAVTTPRETWTDPRLDDLSKKVDDGFEAADKKMDKGFEAANAKMDKGFEAADKKMDRGFEAADKKMDAGFARVDADIRELRGDIKSLRKELLVAAVVIIAAFIGLIPSP